MGRSSEYPLLDGSFPGSEPVALTWAGTSYLAGWAGAGDVGYIAQIDAGANLLGVQTVGPGSGGPGTGTVAPGSVVAVAGNATSLAVAYNDVGDMHAYLELFSPKGAFGGFVDLDTGNEVLALAGTPGTYVVLLSTSTGVMALSVPVTGSAPGSGAADEVSTGIDATRLTSASGGSDGAGAAFALQYADGVWMGYFDPSLANSFELSAVAPGATLADIAGGTGGRLGIFYTIGSMLYGRRIGYASLSGAACAVGTDCASGVCTAQPGVGPKAYSLCQ